MMSDARKDRAEKSTSLLQPQRIGVQRLLVGGAAFAGGLAAAIFQQEGGPALTATLAALAAVGVFSMIVTSVRFVRGDAKKSDDLARTLLSATSDAIALVEDGEQLVEVNAAYLRLSRSGEGQAPTPERFLSRIPGSQAAVGALLRAIADGTHAVQIFPFDPEPTGRRLVAAVHPLEGLKRVVWVLSLSDAEGQRVSGGFNARAGRSDQAAGARGNVDGGGVDGDGAAILTRLWEQAPVGLMLISPTEGRIPNGTLARWLGYDLADWGAAPMAVAELLNSPSEVAVMRAVAQGDAGPGGLAVDFVCKDGSIWPGHVWIGGRSGGENILVVVPRATSQPAGQSAPASLVGGADAAFFTRSPLAMANVDRTGRVVEANGSFSRLFAGSAPAVVGAKLDRLVVERDAPGVERLIKDTLAGLATATPVDASVGGEGGRSARLFAAMLGTGSIAVYAVDTTAQRALEVQFAQSQKMQAIGQLAGGVAHDFNNVLTAILGYCDLLLANHRPSDPSFPDIMQIKQNANRAAGLVRQLLAFSRRQTLRPQVIQLTDVLADLSMLLRRLIGESIDLKVDHGRDLWPVKVDVNQFEQVIVNLAVNARDAMPEGGVLAVRTANVSSADCAAFGDAATLAPADYVLIEVVDTGTGIPSDIIDKIFEPFFSTKEVGKGTGLGLSTVYGIVKQTGGSILAASQPGRGSTFRVFLPRHEPTAEDAVPVPAEPDSRGTDLTGQGTILLVEDEDAVRAFAARALAARGYNVIAAASGAEALEAMDAADTRIDLVVSDVVMPEMDGPTLLKELRARDPALKVIFISGYAQEAFGRSLAEGEKFSFLPKPFSLKQLVAAVKEGMGA
ncbi:response regulator [Aquabacter spiritensis]|uniref:histidine kinase n=1 Tax=Aquabacter spiritensis TaxID=933073 RepID=A0A4R3LP89_9HYPH|nr:response regulator [Aquabacter spiritensis]TCT01516.1 two-component system cell cycle sensor histidine kinase/response regulator CckA [Aquabacter spiritensis]